MKHTDIKKSLKRTLCGALTVLCIFSCACASSDVESTSDQTISETNAPEITAKDTDAPLEDTQAVTDRPETDEITTQIDTTTDVFESETSPESETTPDTYEDVVTDAVTTDSVTTAPAPPKPKEKTSTPVVVGTVCQASDRVIIYGTTEENALITYKGKKTEALSDRARGHNFYVEVNGSGSDTITLYATADGKNASTSITVDVSFGGDRTDVFAGRNSRLFYRPTVSFMFGSIQASSSMLKYTSNRLNAVLKEVQKRTGKDTKLIYLIAPNPVTIYADEQYDYLLSATGGKQHPTAGAQFVAYMNGAGKNEDIIVPDLLKVFNQHKNEMIYFSTDTHWSELGAYYAYKEMMGHINKDFPAAKAHELSEFTIETVNCKGGDLRSMLHIDDMTEETPFLIANFTETGDVYPVKRSDKIGYRIAGINWGLYPKDSYINNSSLPTAYALSDSYGAYLLPFAGMGFSHLRLHGANNNTPIDINEIAKMKPDYIIFNYTDRNIDGNLGMITHLWSAV